MRHFCQQLVVSCLMCTLWGMLLSMLALGTLESISARMRIGVPLASLPVQLGIGM